MRIAGHSVHALGVIAACLLLLFTSPSLALQSTLRTRPLVASPASKRLDVAPLPDKRKTFGLGAIAFSLLPLAGTGRRATLETTVVPGSVWTHDQVQGVVNVNVPVRSTIVKLKQGDGGLWVHNPVAPTKEYLGMVRALEAKHGPVKHVVLGSLGLEHKALAGPFSAQFPNAKVWLQPGQWSFPLQFHDSFFGFPLANIRFLPTAAQDAAAAAAAAASTAAAAAAAAAGGTAGAAASSGGGSRPSSSSSSTSPPWRDEIDFEVLGPLKFKLVGAFGETAFLHKASKTLLVTDAVVRVDDEPPLILEEDPRALLFHARNNVSDEFGDSMEARRRGWRRIAQFGLVFFPSSIRVTPIAQALKAALGLPGGGPSVPPSMKRLGDGAIPLGLYPWAWTEQDEPSFRALQRSGGNPAGLVVAPILRQLIMNREPEVVLDWIERIAGVGGTYGGVSKGGGSTKGSKGGTKKRGSAAASGRGPGRLKNFKRVIPCHFANDLRASPNDLRKAFSFLKQQHQQQQQQSLVLEEEERTQQRLRRWRPRGLTAAPPKASAPTATTKTQAATKVATAARRHPKLPRVGEKLSAVLRGGGGAAPAAKSEDLRLLNSASSLLSKLGIVAPAEV